MLPYGYTTFWKIWRVRLSIIDSVEYSENLHSVIFVVRSFVPMPFTSYCKCTLDIPLSGNKLEGELGHVVYHTYSSNLSKESSQPNNPCYQKLFRLWNRVGKQSVTGKDLVVENVPFFTEKRRE